MVAKGDIKNVNSLRAIQKLEPSEVPFLDLYVMSRFQPIHYTTIPSKILMQMTPIQIEQLSQEQLNHIPLDVLEEYKIKCKVYVQGTTFPKYIDTETYIILEVKRPLLEMIDIAIQYQEKQQEKLRTNQLYASLEIQKVFKKENRISIIDLNKVLDSCSFWVRERIKANDFIRIDKSSVTYDSVLNYLNSIYINKTEELEYLEYFYNIYELTQMYPGLIDESILRVDCKHNAIAYLRLSAHKIVFRKKDIEKTYVR